MYYEVKVPFRVMNSSGYEIILNKGVLYPLSVRVRKDGSACLSNGSFGNEPTKFPSGDLYKVFDAHIERLTKSHGRPRLYSLKYKFEGGQPLAKYARIKAPGQSRGTIERPHDWANMPW